MSTRPLVLLLDDQAAARDSMRDLFDSVGCTVILVSTEESALQEIEARKDLDLVVTDLNLRSGVETDKSGIIFARIVRQIRDDIPIAAYTSRERNHISPNDIRVFDLFQDKADAEGTRKFIQECRSLAFAHGELAPRLLAKVSSRRSTNLSQIENRLRTFEADLNLISKEKLPKLEAALVALERDAVRKEHLKRVWNFSFVVFGLIAGAASIYGAWLAWLSWR